MKYLPVILLLLITTSSALAQEDDTLSLKNDTLSLEDAIAHAKLSDTSVQISGIENILLDPREIAHKKGYDSESVVLRRFDEKKWREIAGNKNYLEQSTPKKKQQQGQFENGKGSNSGKGGQRYETNESDDEANEQEVSGSAPINSVILNYVFYAITIGIIGYILLLVLKNVSIKSKRKVSKEDAGDVTLAITDIKELEIDRLIREAMEKGNYRLVIRIYFLGLLKRLDENGLIVWKKDKTNRDYLTELFTKEHFDEIRNLTLAYELVWYGDHTLSAKTFDQIISSFKEMDQKLNALQPE